MKQDNQNKDDKLKQSLTQAAEKFQALPRAGQVGIIAGVVIVLFLVFGGRGQPQRVQQPVQQQVQQQPTQSDVFSGLNIDTPELLQNFFQQSQQDVAALKDQVEGQLEQQDTALSNALAQNESLQQEIKQILEDFKSEIITIQDNDRRDREVLGQIAEETRKLQQSPVLGGDVPTLNAPVRQKGRISQTPLGSATGVAVDGNQALLSPILNRTGRVNNNSNALPDLEEEEEPRQPFIPPLGFIRATLLNGFDALVGGTATPALARLHGRYRAADNTTVDLDGCWMLLEFSGEISTERAVGKPSRMTCVYPDSGVVTYSVSGYIVDADDGIIGVPGVFYEGDATRLLAAAVADFASGVADIIEQNESTFSVDSDGTSQQTFTGDEARAEIAGGVGNAVGSLRDFLFERASRVVPFIRIDATRNVHVVLLSGIELRPEGSPWTQLFSADN